MSSKFEKMEELQLDQKREVDSKEEETANRNTGKIRAELSHW